ncbi:MAG: thiol protease/hemagglutinin PrtT [Bacteroidales bacterium]|nr:thiol protease/hemagglutinin PrtT [Bacteroidales bacterium]
MKKFCLYFSFILLTLNLFAAPVDPTTAAKVATNFYRQQTIAKTLFKQQAQPALLNVTAQTPYQHMYVFNVEGDNGFVLVAGDDRSIPVLGYSDEGRFDYDNLPDNARAWITHYEEELAWIVANDAEPYETTAGEWTTLLNGGLLETKGGSVGPLIETKWGQGSPYNLLCPYDNAAGERAVTGCVATAMAQIMKYWEHPTRGTGSHTYTDSDNDDFPGQGAYGTLSANFGSTTYDWANMPISLTNSNTTTQQKAVATLMYHCGVAVEMNYDISSRYGSGSNNYKAMNGLSQYFGYSSQMQYVQKNNYSQTIWTNLLKQELDNGRPILYGGQISNASDAGGHSFICDGYGNDNYFHFNWGWGGSEDAYYLINYLQPGSYNFSYQQSAVIGIQPTGNTPPSTNYDLSMYAPLSTDANSYNFGAKITVTYQIANNGTSAFNGYIRIGMVDASDNTVVDAQVSNATTINSGYYIRNSLTFSGRYPKGTYYVQAFYCTDVNNTDTYNVVKSTSSNSNAAQFTVKSFSMPIETYSNFTSSSGSTLYTGEQANIQVNVANTGSSTFYGKVALMISDVNGNNIQTFGTQSFSSGLQSNKYITTTFSGTISANAGNYYLALIYQNQGESSWYYAGSTYYTNPIGIIIEKGNMNPDSYEPNNTAATASYIGSVTSNRTFNIKANLHTSTDRDYYKIYLPAGYKYTVSAQMNDSYVSSSFTAFAEMYVSTDGTTIAGGYDNEMPTMTINNGGNIYFKINGYNGNNNDIGTYQLIINVSRIANTGIEEVKEDKIVLYPNPAIDKLHLTMNEGIKVKKIELMNAEGQLLRTYNGNEREFNVGDLPSGLYFMRIVSTEGVTTKKWIKQ